MRSFGGLIFRLLLRCIVLLIFTCYDGVSTVSESYIRFYYSSSKVVIFVISFEIVMNFTDTSL